MTRTLYLVGPNAAGLCDLRIVTHGTVPSDELLIAGVTIQELRQFAGSTAAALAILTVERAI